MAELEDLIDAEPIVIDSLLNDVDYSNTAEYVPSEFALGFINFIKMVNGEKGEESLTPVIHYKMLDQIAGDESNIANMCSRGLAKSAVFAEYLILYLAVYTIIPGFGRVFYALYVSDSIDNGVKKMRKRIERRRENSPFLMHYIPEVKFTDIRWGFKNLEEEEFVVSGHGAKTGVRGTVELNSRPQLAILDDLISDEDARSATIIASVEDTVYKAIDYALHPKKNKIIWSGTPFNARDPLYKAIESGAWAVNVFPVCEKFPCSRSEFKSGWPDRFDYDYVLAKYMKAKKVGKLDSFNQELMLRIMSEEDRLVHDGDIVLYPRNNVLNNKHLFNFYITTDFATSEESASDYSVISVWAYNCHGDWLWVDGVCEKQLMDKNMDDLFRLAQMYKPQSVGVEVSGQQGGFIAWIRNEMMDRNHYFTIASEGNNNKPGIRPSTKTRKIDRFHTVLPLFKTHKIWFPEEMQESPIMIECMDELKLASVKGFKSKYDDFIDTITMLTSMNAWRPAQNAPEMATEEGQTGNHNIWDDDDFGESHTRTNRSYIV